MNSNFIRVSNNLRWVDVSNVTFLHPIVVLSQYILILKGISPSDTQQIVLLTISNLHS
jgi:hypothetical protein